MQTKDGLKKRTDALAEVLGTDASYYILEIEMWSGPYRIEVTKDNRWGMGALWWLMKKNKGGGTTMVRELNPKEVIEFAPKIALDGKLMRCVQDAKKSLEIDPTMTHKQGNADWKPDELAPASDPGSNPGTEDRETGVNL
jgi:hypothetical protein